MVLDWMVGGLASRGVEVTVASTAEGAPNDRLLSRTGVEVRLFECQTRFYKVSFPLARWIRRHAREFDVVHAHALFSFAPVAACTIAASKGVPYVVRPLGVLNRYGMQERRPLLKRISTNLVERRVLRRAAAVHFTTPDEAAQAALIVPNVKSIVIPHGIPALPDEPDARTVEVPGDENGHRILFLGRLSPEKNLEALLDALTGVIQVVPELTLLVAGSGPAEYVAALRERARARDLEGHVAWLGHVQGDRKRSLLRAADVFVLPSHSENFGISAVEAMSAGLPVVLSEGVAIADSVVAAGAGVAVTPTSPSIAGVLLDLIQDEAKRSEMARRARALARDTYSVDTMCESLVSLYRSILEG